MIIKVNRNTEEVSYTAANTWACFCEVGERAKQPSRLCQRWSHYLELLKSWAAGWLMRLWRSTAGTQLTCGREFGERNRIWHEIKCFSQDPPQRRPLPRRSAFILPALLFQDLLKRDKDFPGDECECVMSSSSAKRQGFFWKIRSKVGIIH